MVACKILRHKTHTHTHTHKSQVIPQGEGFCATSSLEAAVTIILYNEYLSSKMGTEREESFVSQAMLLSVAIRICMHIQQKVERFRGAQNDSGQRLQS